MKIYHDERVKRVLERAERTRKELVHWKEVAAKAEAERDEALRQLKVASHVVEDLQAAMSSNDPIAALNCRVTEYHWLKEDVARQESVNAKLVEALESFVTYHSGHVMEAGLGKKMQQARAALALAKGE